MKCRNFNIFVGYNSDMSANRQKKPPMNKSQNPRSLRAEGRGLTYSQNTAGGGGRGSYSFLLLNWMERFQCGEKRKRKKTLKCSISENRFHSSVSVQSIISSLRRQILYTFQKDTYINQRVYFIKRDHTRNNSILNVFKLVV